MMEKAHTRIGSAGKTLTLFQSSMTSSSSMSSKTSTSSQIQSKKHQLHHSSHLKNLHHRKHHTQQCNQHHSHLNRAGHNVYQNHPNLCSRLHKVSSQLVIMLKQVVLQMMSMGTLLLHSSRKWKTTPSHFPRLKHATIGHAGSKPWLQRSPLLIALAHGVTSHSRHIRRLWEKNGFTVSRGKQTARSRNTRHIL